MTFSLPSPSSMLKLPNGNDAYREPIVHAYNILCNLETVHSFIIIGGFLILAKNNRSDYIFQLIWVTRPVCLLNLAKFEDTAPLRQTLLYGVCLESEGLTPL